jgi:hypothetical protein
MEKSGAHFPDRNAHPRGRSVGRWRITITYNAMPATLNIDLNQTTIKSPAMYALERLHAEPGGQILQNKKEAKRLAQCMMRRCWIAAWRDAQDGRREPRQQVRGHLGAGMRGGWPVAHSPVRPPNARLTDAVRGRRMAMGATGRSQRAHALCALPSFRQRRLANGRARDGL